MTKFHAADEQGGEGLPETIWRPYENLFGASPLYPALRLAADVLIEVQRDGEDSEGARVSRAEGKAK